MPIDPALAALLSFGGGLASAAGPSRVPTGLGQAAGQAGMGGLAGYMQAQQMARQERKADLEALQLAMKARQSRQQREAVQKYAQHLPEEQRALATAFPQIAAQQHAKSMFAEPTSKPPRIETFIQGGQEIQKQWDPEAGEWVELGRGARWKPATEEKPGFGASIVGRARDTLREYDAYVRNEQKPPPEVETRARQAAHILTEPQTIRMPDGSVVQYTPGITEGLAYPGEPKETAGTTDVERGTGEGTITELAESPTTERAGQAFETIEDITSLLNEATEAGETITGVQGTAKALGGGLARQAGIPVGQRSKKLQRSIETLKAQVTPIVLGEAGKTLSDKDRQRVDDIVGTLSWATDEVDIRSALNDLLDILSRAEAGGGVQQESGSGTGDIGQMSLDDLTKLDPTTMSADELRAAAQRYDELAAQE